MKIHEIITESKTSKVERLKRKLVAAKSADRKLDYDAIDRMMRDIAGDDKEALQRLHDDFVEQCGSIPDKWIKNQKINTSMNEEIDMKLLSNLPTLSKIIFLEEYVTRNGMLIESNTKHDIEHFMDLIDISIDPTPGKNYIVVSLMLVSDRIMMFGPPIIGKFIGTTGDRELEFVDSESGDTKVYPPKITRRVKSVTGTFVFDSNDKYETFKTILNLRWDYQLPDFGDFVSEGSKKYLGPTDRVKIDRRGWQTPLRTRGFGGD